MEKITSNKIKDKLAVFKFIPLSFLQRYMKQINIFHFENLIYAFRYIS